MELSYSLHEEQGIKYAVIEMAGDFDVNSFLEFYSGLMLEEKIGHIKAIIWEGTGLNMHHVESCDVDRLIEFIQGVSERRKGGKAAWVVSGPLQFGLSRMFALKAEPRIDIKMRTFYNLNDAKKWVLQDDKDV